MEQAFIRAEMLYGPAAMARLKNARVAVFGIGGVGGVCAEALVRTGVGEIHLIDDDRVSPSNLNRQIFALRSTLGLPKTQAAKQRLLDISPSCRVVLHRTFYLPGNTGEIDLRDFHYIVDAVDTVTAKLFLAEQAQKAGVPIISAMGTGNKRDITALRIGDISETSVCPLARIMRKECRKRGIRKLTCVYSTEDPAVPLPVPGIPEETTPTDTRPAAGTSRRQTPASNAFVPPAAGLLMASRVVEDLIAGAQ